MSETQYLSEERYKSVKLKLQIIALIILVIGIFFGGLLLYKGININTSDRKKIEAQQHQEFMQNDFSEKYYELEEQLEKYDSKYIFIGIGSVILIFSGVISLGIFITSKKREINAFYVQQSMPIAQEGIEKISPSVGVAAKEISKGIKEGMKDEE